MSQVVQSCIRNPRNESQYDAGYVELVDCLAGHFEDKTSYHITRTFDQGPVKTNKWDSADLAETDNTPRAKAENKYKQTLAYIKFKYCPEMKPVRVLYCYNDDGQPREPVYLFGPVVAQGGNFPTGNNNADYIDNHGSYDIVRFLKNHASMFLQLIGWQLVNYVRTSRPRLIVSHYSVS